MQHRLDPAKLHAAAAAAGRALAEAHATWCETRMLCREIAQEASGVDPIGLAVRLAWTAQDTARDHVRQRRMAEDAVRRAVRPLIAARLSVSAIEEAAGTAGGHALGWPQIYSILRDEIARARGRGRREAA